MKHERVRTYVLISQFSTKISAVDIRLFLKNYYSYFRVTFSKTLSLLAQFYMVSHTLSCSETILMAANETATRRIYTSLLVWMHVQWLRATYSKQCIYTYLARKGLKRKNLVLTNFLSYYNIILLQYIYYNITISSNYVTVIAFACKA